MDADLFEFWQAELKRLDLLLHRQILRLRVAYQLSLDEFRGLYISDEQVDQLARQVDAQQDGGAAADLAARSQGLRAANAARLTADHPLRRLTVAFGLSAFEQEVVLLALAPELDLKYETLLAYLNNDVTRKWPTCDLALRLFSARPTPDASLRRYLVPTATLFEGGILRLVSPASERPSWLATGLALAPAVMQFLLGTPSQGLPLPACAKRSAPPTTWDALPVSEPLKLELQQATALLRRPDEAWPVIVWPVIVMEGRDGSSAILAAEAMCRELSVDLITVHLDAARATGEPIAGVCQSLRLATQLAPAAIYLDRTSVVFDGEGNPLPECTQWLDHLWPRSAPLFVFCEPGMRWRELLRGRRTFWFGLSDPDYLTRRTLWQQYLAERAVSVSTKVLDDLAGRFTLTASQIRDAVTEASDDCQRTGAGLGGLSFDAAVNAARAQSGQNLGRLAVKVTCRHSWEDLVLPAATLGHVKEVAAAIKQRQTVYSQWGFERRISWGSGLTVLFAGASGTGKTMAAGVIARDLGLDLYKIDLSGVVSKYIGETEKNLDRIFRAAHCSNAILFFDEADALFGKRSEVKDAHDRYANIEVAYLLQKMEEHNGAVILASNLRKNIDEAFSRRMQYVVEFPLPGEAQREQLWHSMFPDEAPVGSDVDFCFLAKQFPIPGGDIRNVALTAAFLAAQDGQIIGMEVLVKAMARQMMKQGKVPSAADFKQYHAWITSAK